MRLARWAASAVLVAGMMQGQAQGPVAATETKMQHARGTFEVKMTPQGEKDAVPGRMTLDKQFHGDLDGTSRGEMLMFMTAVKGSAGYVAIEEVKGTLAGRSGSFALQHSGTMARAVPTLSVTVVPDSGTGELAGLTGTMTIEVEEGKHSYTFEYSLDTVR